MSHCGYCGAPRGEHSRDERDYCARQSALFEAHPEWTAA